MTPGAASTHPRRRPWKRWMVALTAGVLILVVWAVWPKNELSYKGKSYRRWVLDYSDSFLDSPKRSPEVTEQLQRDAGEAIRNVGTNGIPVLLELMSFKGSPLVATGARLARHNIVPGGWVAPGLYKEHHFHSAGYGAFAVLGGDARPAIPALRISATNSDPDIRVWVEGALRRIEEGSETNK